MGQGSGGLRDKVDDVKRQIGGDDKEQPKIYELLNVKNGDGKLIELMKQSLASSGSGSGSGSVGDYGGSDGGNSRELLESKIDEQIRRLVRPMLYNDGRGKMVPLSRLALLRFGCNLDIDDDSELDAVQNQSGTLGADSLTLSSDADSNGHISSRPSGDGLELGALAAGRFEQRLVCWKLSERGAVGETALHICFLLSTTTHMQLARRLLRLFPTLINDFYTSDVYFGESALHMSIVNEDVKMLKTLLDAGANVHERCLGSFFLCEDQKAKVNCVQRRLADKLQRLTAASNQSGQTKAEVAQLLASHRHSVYWSSNLFQSTQTNYDGYCYWGEFPLSFAVSLNLEHSFRLLLANGANPNLRDSNGNTTLHMAVIAGRLEMFDLCYSSGADIRAKNRQQLTPLTLAAKLERVEMFFHILEIQRQVEWIFCDVAFVDIPLDEIDSIDTVDGSSVEESALSIVVFGGSNAHLKMLDSFLGQLLTVKWNSTQKSKFFSMLCHFTILFVLSIVSYATRTRQPPSRNSAPIVLNEQLNADFIDVPITTNSTLSKPTNNSTMSILVEQILELSSSISFNYANVGCEVLLVVLIAFYLQSAFFRTLRGRSVHSLLETVALSPEMSLFFLTSLLILACIPLKAFNYHAVEDTLMAFITFTLPLKFLFFCRAFRSVGPFVVMIYKIVVNDLLCFVAILLIFVFGFSQSFSIIFKSHRDSKAMGQSEIKIGQDIELIGSNYFENFLDGILSMHLMALNEFGMVFDQFEATQFPNISKALFLIYMILVSILLINMLIAMLGRTFQEIASQPNEDLRQWARTLLMIERSWKDSDKLNSLDKYSHEKTIRTVRADENGIIELVDVKSRFYRTTWTLKTEDRKRIKFIKKLTEDNMKNAQKLRQNSYAKRHLY